MLIVTLVTAPLEIDAVAEAPVPSPAITTVGAEVYPLPPAVTDILSTSPVTSCVGLPVSFLTGIKSASKNLFWSDADIVNIYFQL